MYDHTLIQYAFDKDGNRISIYDVPYGENTGCFCRLCNSPLGAKNKGKKRNAILKPNQKAAHFYHLPSSKDKNCNGETIIHILAKEVFAETKKLILIGEERNHLVTFNTVENEKKYIFGDTIIVPDSTATVFSKDKNKILFVEFAYTNPVNDEKIKCIKKIEQNCIQINLKNDLIEWNEYQDMKSLKERMTIFLHLECSNYQKWIFNKKYKDAAEIPEESMQEVKDDKLRRALIHSKRKKQINATEQPKYKTISKVLGIANVRVIELLKFEQRLDFLDDKHFFMHNGYLSLKEKSIQELRILLTKHISEYGGLLNLKNIKL